MPPPRVEFEPTISAGERPQTYALDRAATGTGCVYHVSTIKQKSKSETMFIKTILSICPRILQYNAEEKPQETTR